MDTESSDEPEPGTASPALPRWFKVAASAAALGFALLLSAVLGLTLPTREDAERAGGQWYWVVSEGKGFQVKSKTEDRCGVPIYVGRELIQAEGFFLPTVIKRRVWTHDPNRDLDDPAILDAVRRAMLARDEAAPWAGALSAPGRMTGERVWLGTFAYGAAVVFPALGLGLLSASLGRRGAVRILFDRARRRALCTHCGYSLRGLDPEDADRCPECGAHRAETTASASSSHSRKIPTPA